MLFDVRGEIAQAHENESPVRAFCTRYDARGQ